MKLEDKLSQNLSKIITDNIRLSKTKAEDTSNTMPLIKIKNNLEEAECKTT